MSIRIYQISKQIGLSNRELLDVLKQRGFQVKSVSSTIDNISADALIQEYIDKKKSSQDPQPAPPPPKQTVEIEDSKVKKPSQLLSGAFVKSKEDVEQERSARVLPKVPAKLLPKPMPPQGSARSAPPAKPQHSKADHTQSTPVVPQSSSTLSSGPSFLLAGTPIPVPKRSPSIPREGLPPDVVTAPLSTPCEQTADASASETEKPPRKTIRMKTPIVVRDFAGLIGLKPFRLISELMEIGIFGSMNQVIEPEVAVKIAEQHGCELVIKHRREGRGRSSSPPPKPKNLKADEEHLLELRPPVVCILGHVDHGKTTLLDAIRKTRVADREAGGITQHIGAYQVLHNEQKITFIDTPGHAAFSKMRERGANVTDIGVLVVAADDGFKPQTDEALKFARQAGIPIVVAINKIDAKGANIDNVKIHQQQRNLTSEDWGGDTLTVPLSALKGEGIEELLEALLLQSEMMELKANPKASAEGIILEARREIGRGCTASVIIQKGTLKTGDVLVSGQAYCKVRAMIDDCGKNVKTAAPSTPVNLVGWSGVPDAGAAFSTVENEKEARLKVENWAEDMKREGNELVPGVQSLSGEELIDLMAERQQKLLKLILKADVKGSLEALTHSLEAIKSEKVSLEILSGDVGPISKNDVTRAAAVDALVVGFSVKQEAGVAGLAKHHGVRILQHEIIYELIDQVKEALRDLLDPEVREEKLGTAQVRQTFPIGRGLVAGCKVAEGRIQRDYLARLVRKGKVIHEARIDTLKRFKDDVQEVRGGYECGIHLQNCEDYQEGDTIESFAIHKVRAEL